MYHQHRCLWHVRKDIELSYAYNAKAQNFWNGCIAQPKSVLCIRFFAVNHSKKLNKIIRQTFPAASLQLQFRTHPIIPQNSKDKLPSSTTSMCIYKFNCSCGSSYIGRTTRQLSKRIKEHNPAWLRKGLTKSIQSSIVQHLVDTGHQINTDDAFSICYRVPLRSTKSARTRLLHIAEAVAIKIFRPDLCVQKKFVQTLVLPWPKIF